jgi:hypothetical protein
MTAIHRQNVKPLRFNKLQTHGCEHLLAGTLGTTRFNIKEFCMLLTLRLCVLYGPQNKHQRLPYTSLTDWFL